MKAKPDMFHGVDGGGNCLPGPQVPRGVVRVGPDMVNHNTSGYASGEEMRHFSHLHVAGTGGAGRYGNIGIVPMGQSPDARSASFILEDEEAEPGYYGVRIRQRGGFGEMANSGAIGCELTATRCCGLHRWTFAESLDPWVRIDVGACIAGQSQGGWARWQGDRVLVGCGHYRGGWGHELPYSVFFRIEFSCPVREVSAVSQSHAARGDGEGEGANLVIIGSFSGVRRVESRVGISFVSIAQAQRHLEAETGGLAFEAVRNRSAGEWERLLGRFRVAGGSTQDETLWTTLWQRLHAMPGELGADEVPWMPVRYRHFNDLYCLWDSVRCANSLFALVDAPFAADLNNCLMEIGEQSGWIPDAWIMGGSAQIQGGCSAAVLFAEGAVKKLPGFDGSRALRALLATIENASPNPQRYGRYPGWGRDGYLSTAVKNCASRTVEYAFHDHCAALLAETVGEVAVAERCRRRAERLWESWHEGYRCFAPRDERGVWVEFDPWRPQCRDFWNDPHFYEGTGYDYLVTAWHAMEEIVRRTGGAEPFAAHLDRYLEHGHFWKEINLHAPWLYHYAGMPERVAPALRSLMDGKVKPGRRGLSDNEDMGAWASWWLTGAMGLCPVPGSERYLVAVPRFERVEIDLIGGTRPLSIERSGPADGAFSGVSLDGTRLDRAWLLHAEIAVGARITVHTA